VSTAAVISKSSSAARRDRHGRCGAATGVALQMRRTQERASAGNVVIH